MEDKWEICEGVMGNYTSVRVNSNFKISLMPLIVTHRLRRVSERGVNCE